MSQIIRYVHIEDNIVEVRESFLGFFFDVGKDCRGYVKRYSTAAGKRWAGYCVVQGSRSVSYTHLDVYKRQTQNCAAVLLDSGSDDNNKFC